jgi:hypothetical protein
MAHFNEIGPKKTQTNDVVFAQMNDVCPPVLCLATILCLPACMMSAYQCNVCLPV